MINTLAFYGGVLAAIIPDNLKSAVKKSHLYEPEISDRLEDFALYKALVENAVKITYRRVFVSFQKKIFDLKSLNEAIFELLEIHNN